MKACSATVYRADQTGEQFDLPGDPETDSASFDMIRECVGGYLEVVVTRSGLSMYVDEDGLPKRLPINRVASEMAGRPIVGTAVVVVAI